MGCGASKAPDSETLNFLKEVPLFKRLPEDLHSKLAGCATQAVYKPGQLVVRQGDEGKELFVIKKGTATVHVDGKKVAVLKAGDYFGEAALLHDEPRNATITASADMTAIKVSQEDFRKMGLHQKLEFAKRGAVGGGGPAKVESKEPSPKTNDEKKLMKEALLGNANLQLAFKSQLDDAKINQLIEKMWKEDVAKDTKIITAGDLNADYFYIVQSGSFNIIVGQASATSVEQAVEKGDGKADAGLKIEAGGSFGELALLYFAPRAADVVASEASVLWVIDRGAFRTILSDFFDNKLTEYVKLLEECEVLKDTIAGLENDKKKEVAQALNEMIFTKGQTIFEQGAAGDAFYILLEGSVQFLNKGQKDGETSAGNGQKAAYFGEKALLGDAPRLRTIQVTSESARTLMIDKVSFEMLTGKGPAPGAPGTGKEYGTIKRNDLKKLGLLGCGGFGAVFMVEHNNTKESYALKQLSKGYVVKAGMQKSVVSEKVVQMMCDSNFVVQLYETYNSDQNLELLLELALGGELYATYNKKAFWGKVDHAKFYTAGTVYAFEHLHSKKIIFRDLKPENLLLNERGEVKLTDMGLAKVVPGTTFTTCGTPDYFAPELIASKGHTKAVDWWTLGILTFELLGGHPPFEAASPMQIYQKVNKGINKVQFPKACKGDAEDLIKNLCHANPPERLPMSKAGIQGIKDHSWYASGGFDWDAMFKLEAKPPYKPVVKSKTDLANFNARKEDMPPQITYKDDKSGWDKDFATST